MNGIDIVVGSRNPVKVQAVREAFTAVYGQGEMSCRGVEAPSGVSDQPIGEKETLQGAKNRLCYIRKQCRNATHWVGIEGGITVFEGAMYGFAWVVVDSVVCSSDPSAFPKLGTARSASFLIPLEVRNMIESGMELGDANDRYFKIHSSKKGLGAIGLLTGGVISREQLYVPPVIMALIPYLDNGFNECA